MSQTKQAVGERPIPVGRDPNVDAARKALYGSQLQKGLLAAGAAGLGVGGLYYLSNYLTDKYRKATQLPAPEELAAAPISDVTAPEEEDESILPEMPTIKLPEFLSARSKAAKFDPMFLYAPALGAGAGALLGAAQAGKGRKRQNAILGATIGGLGGLGTAAATSKPLWHYVSKNMPKELLPGLSTDPDANIPAETPQEAAWRAVANATIPAAGAAGGLALADSVARQRRNEQNLQNIEGARRDYFTALTGREPPVKNKDDAEDDAEQKEKKGSVDAALDALYESYVAGTGRFEKASEDAPAGVTGTNTFWNYIQNLGPQAKRTWPEFGSDLFGGVKNTKDDVLTLTHKLMLAGGLGAGAMGAKYMYDRTRARSESRNLLKAQEARRRMQGLDSPWVDPKELADVKNLAMSSEAASTRGV